MEQQRQHSCCYERGEGGKRDLILLFVVVTYAIVSSVAGGEGGGQRGMNFCGW
jgi:hypothetical protein